MSAYFKATEWTRYLPIIYDDHSYADVTLVCEGNQILVHRSVLASLSPFFRDLLSNYETSVPPVIILEGFRHKILNLLINFFYNGVAEGSSEEILTLSKYAKDLKIKCLTNSGHPKPLVKLELLEKKSKINEQLQKLQSHDSESESSSSEDDILEIVYEKKTGTNLVGNHQTTEGKPNITLQHQSSHISSGSKRAYPQNSYYPHDVQEKKLKPVHPKTSESGTGLPCISQGKGTLKPFKCTICKENFTNKLELRAHLRSNHSELLTCSICDKLFSTRASLKRHLKNHISSLDGLLATNTEGSLCSIDATGPSKDSV